MNHPPSSDSPLRPSTFELRTSTVSLTIDGHPVSVPAGASVLDAARSIGLEIPTLCYLEKCGPLTTCLACVVKVNGRIVPSCGTRAEPGMAVESETNEVHEARKTALELLFSDHVGDCLSPCNRLCPLRMNIPVMIRQIHSGKLVEASGTIREALPLAAVLGRLCHHPCEQGCRRAAWDQSAGIREMERFVADWDLGISGKARRVDYPGATSTAAETESPIPPVRPASGKSVMIVGAGPAGLTAAYHLLRQGHQCVIADRHPEPGGTLRDVPERQLPKAVLAAETNYIKRMGAQFRLETELGRELKLDALCREFDAVLLTVGEITREQGQSLGLEMSPGGIKVKPETCETNLPGVFAAGRSVKPVPQLVRAMSEGMALAECVNQYLVGNQPHREGKPFSSIMGRLAPSELETFARGASVYPAVAPCDTCSGLTAQEAATEASRCLHCDCRSSGNCALQTYAQQYSVDASRFREERREFEQHIQPGGIIFEPGKCILCGICVKLTEMAREPLGLTFIGRGFDVRLAAPFDRSIEEGLQKVAAECVYHCPTGAIEFRGKDEPPLTTPNPAPSGSVVEL